MLLPICKYYEYCHIGVVFTDAELINAKVSSKVAEILFTVNGSELLLVDLFNPILAHRR